MASKLFILCFSAIVFIGLVIGDDYEGEGGGEGDDGAVDEGYGQHYGGGDYEGEGGDANQDGGDYQAAPVEETEDAAASQQFAQYIHPALQRQKRSLNTDDSKRVLRRVRRGGKGIVGPVYTYQKTDHHGNFKWGKARKLLSSKS